MFANAPVRSRVFLPIGAVAAIVGLLPWLITGMRLPLQNLWASATTSAEMPIVLLPLSQYSVALTAAVLLIGATIAGIAGRVIAARHRPSALAELMGGVLLVQVIATVQTAMTVSRGLVGGGRASLYLAALVGAIVVAILLGLGMLALIARAQRAGVLIGMSVAAIAFSFWLGGLLQPVTAVDTTSSLTRVLWQVESYVPATVIGLAIAWCGIATIGRVIAAIASLVLVGFGPIVVAAVTAAIGSRVLVPYPREMLDYGVRMFDVELATPSLWLPMVAVAIVVAAVGIVALRTISRRAAGATS